MDTISSAIFGLLSTALLFAFYIWQRRKDVEKIRLSATKTDGILYQPDGAYFGLTSIYRTEKNGTQLGLEIKMADGETCIAWFLSLRRSFGRMNPRFHSEGSLAQAPNNSFNPTAGVGLVINQRLGPAAG